jgi:hypothetical protein
MEACSSATMGFFPCVHHTILRGAMAEIGYKLASGVFYPMTVTQ